MPFGSNVDYIRKRGPKIHYFEIFIRGDGHWFTATEIRESRIRYNRRPKNKK